jgi:hypothetical protein
MSNSNSLKEYKQGQAFSGVIGRTFDVSAPARPAPNRAREGAPNVLFIVLDDTGFGQLGCNGCPITTPKLNALAADAGSPVMTDYTPPFPFSGHVKKVMVDVSGTPVEDMEAKIKMYLARQ